MPRSERSRTLTARTGTAKKVARSECPYCAVGCGHRVYLTGGEVTQIEGDPDSPISRGRRPARFHYMLRVAKPTSPMSVGSWILVGLR